MCLIKTVQRVYRADMGMVDEFKVFGLQKEQIPSEAGPFIDM